MPFPITAREIYERHTLEQVITQLRYPTILQVVAESPAQFQNAVRHYYPLYEEQRTSNLPKEVSDIFAQFPMGGLPQQPEHKFLTEDGRRLISLTKDFIAVSEKDYITWNAFRAEITYVEELFRGIYQPAFYSRVGLRYSNVISKSELNLENNTWNDLLNERLIGNLADQHIGNEVSATRAQTTLTLPDVVGGRVVLRHGLSITDPQIYTIDSDFYTDEKCQPEDAYEVLDRFNKWGGNLLRWAIKPALRDALKPTQV